MTLATFQVTFVLSPELVRNYSSQLRWVGITKEPRIECSFVSKLPFVS